MVYCTFLFVIIGICYTKAEKTVTLNLSNIDDSQFTSNTLESPHYTRFSYSPIANNKIAKVIDDGIKLWDHSDDLELQSVDVYYKDLVANLIILNFTKQGQASSKYYKRDQGTFKELDAEEFKKLSESKDFLDKSLVLDLDLGLSEKYFDIVDVEVTGQEIKSYELKEGLDLLKLNYKDKVLLDKSQDGSLVKAFVSTEPDSKLKIMLEVLKEGTGNLKLFEVDQGDCRELSQQELNELLRELKSKIQPEAPPAEAAPDEESAPQAPSPEVPIPEIKITPASPERSLEQSELSEVETEPSPAPPVVPPSTPVSTESDLSFLTPPSPPRRTLSDLVGPQNLQKELEEAHKSLESDDLSEDLLKPDSEDEYVPIGLGSTDDLLTTPCGPESEEESETCDLPEPESQETKKSELSGKQPQEVPQKKPEGTLPKISEEDEGADEESEEEEPLDGVEHVEPTPLPPTALRGQPHTTRSPIRQHVPSAPPLEEPAQPKGQPETVSTTTTTTTSTPDSLILDEDVDPKLFNTVQHDLGNGLFEKIYQPKQFEIHHVRYYLIHWDSDEHAVKCTDVVVNTLDDEVRALKLNVENKDGSSKSVYYCTSTYTEVDENKYNELLEQLRKEAQDNASNKTVDLNLSLREQRNVVRVEIVERFRNPYYKFVPADGYKFKTVSLNNKLLWQASEAQPYVSQALYYEAQGSPAYVNLTIPEASSFQKTLTLDLLTKKPVQELEPFQVGFLLQKPIGHGSHLIFDLADPIDHEAYKVEKQNFKEFIARDYSTRYGRVIAILDNKERVTPTNVVPFKSFKVYYHRYYPVYIVTDPILCPRYFNRTIGGWALSHSYDLEKDIRAIAGILDDELEFPHKTLWLDYENPEPGKYLIEVWTKDEVTFKTMMPVLNSSMYYISCNGAPLLSEKEPRSVGVKFYVKKGAPYKAELLIRVSRGLKKLLFKVFSKEEKKWNVVDESLFERI